MFILTKFSDLVQIPPREFSKRSRDAIEDRINEKYSNKVVQKVGLCICLWDLLKASDGLIGHGTGNVNINVEFRMLVFRPFKGEIIAGTVKESTTEGVRVTTEFFEDIFVPSTMLFEGSIYDEKEKTWVWRPDENAELFFDNGTKVHIRIEREKWEDLAPRGPASESQSEDTKEIRRSPYSIEASMAEEGLGGVEWCITDLHEATMLLPSDTGFFIGEMNKLYYMLL